MSVVINFPKEAEGSSSGGMGNIWANYLAFVRGASGDELDAAFGRNNEDLIQGLGTSFAMYAKFKDPGIDIDITFPNLIQCDTLDDIATGTPNEICALSEMKNNNDIMSLIVKSRFAASKFFNEEYPIFKDGQWTSEITDFEFYGEGDTATPITPTISDGKAVFALPAPPHNNARYFNICSRSLVTNLVLSGAYHKVRIKFSVYNSSYASVQGQFYTISNSGNTILFNGSISRNTEYEAEQEINLPLGTKSGNYPFIGYNEQAGYPGSETLYISEITLIP